VLADKLKNLFGKLLVNDQPRFVAELSGRAGTGVAAVMVATAGAPAAGAVVGSSANFASRAPHHFRTHRSTTAAAIPALPKMDLQQ
jgi:hypothetical protein